MLCCQSPLSLTSYTHSSHTHLTRIPRLCIVPTFEQPAAVKEGNLNRALCRNFTAPKPKKSSPPVIVSSPDRFFPVLSTKEKVFVVGEITSSRYSIPKRPLEALNFVTAASRGFHHRHWTLVFEAIIKLANRYALSFPALTLGHSPILPQHNQPLNCHRQHHPLAAASSWTWTGPGPRAFIPSFLILAEVCFQLDHPVRHQHMR